MTGIRKILAATDLSEYSQNAVTRAAMLCGDLRCEEIELLSVQEGALPDTLELTREATVVAAEVALVNRTMGALQLISGQLEDNYGIRSSNTVKIGKPEQEIILRAESLPADLIVIGAHGGNFLTKFLLGSTATKLARTSKRPLLVVKKHPVKAYGRILVPVDFSQDSRHAAYMAMKIAPQAKLFFLHIYDGAIEARMRYGDASERAISANRVEAGEEARQNLSRFLEDLQIGARAISRMVIFGHPGHVINDYAGKMKADLIVLGKHGRSCLEEMLLGSVTQHVLGKSSRDILVVTAAARPGQNTG